MDNTLISDLLSHSDVKSLPSIEPESPDMRGISQNIRKVSNNLTSYTKKVLDTNMRRKYIDTAEKNIFTHVGGNAKQLNDFVSIGNTMSKHKKVHFYDKSKNVDVKFKELEESCSKLIPNLQKLTRNLQIMKGIDNPSCIRKEMLQDTLSTFTKISELNTLLDKKFRSRDINDIIKNFKRLGHLFGDDTFGDKYVFNKHFDRFKTEKLPKEVLEDIERALDGADEGILKKAHKAFKLHESIPINAKAIMQAIESDTVFSYLSRRYLPLPTNCITTQLAITD